jgi:hypothetical protein
VSNVARDGLDGLDAGRAGADHGDALAREIDRRMRPSCGMKGSSSKIVAAFDARQGRRRQRADRGDQETCAEAAAVLQCDAPALCGLVIGRCRHPAPKLDVAAQIEFVGDVIEIAQVSGWPAKCSDHSYSSSNSLENE